METPWKRRKEDELGRSLRDPSVGRSTYVCRTRIERVSDASRSPALEGVPLPPPAEVLVHAQGLRARGQFAAGKQVLNERPGQTPPARRAALDLHEPALAAASRGRRDPRPEWAPEDAAVAANARGSLLRVDQRPPSAIKRRSMSASLGGAVMTTGCAAKKRGRRDGESEPPRPRFLATQRISIQAA